MIDDPFMPLHKKDDRNNIFTKYHDSRSALNRSASKSVLHPLNSTMLWKTEDDRDSRSALNRSASKSVLHPLNSTMLWKTEDEDPIEGFFDSFEPIKKIKEIKEGIERGLHVSNSYQKRLATKRLNLRNLMTHNWTYNKMLLGLSKGKVKGNYSAYGEGLRNLKKNKQYQKIIAFNHYIKSEAADIKSAKGVERYFEMLSLGKNLKENWIKPFSPKTDFGKSVIKVGKGLGSKFSKAISSPKLAKGITNVISKGGKVLKFVKKLGWVGKVLGAADTGYTIYKAKDKAKAIATEAGDGIGSAVGGQVGAYVGAALGSLIPIPVVGTAVGGILGSLVGSWIGGKIGKWGAGAAYDKWVKPKASAHATGGLFNQPHLGLVAEEGPEAIIPLSGGKRSRGLDLWTKAGRMLGVVPYANGGIISGKSPAFHSEYTGRLAPAAPKISIPNISFTFQINSADSKNIVDQIKNHAEEIVNTISLALAPKLEKAFANRTV